ncbi:protein of unknown function [Streptomyces sp. KY75]|nr:protein of unknown function [Streptomyces sp. KY75]CAD5982060.1 protein of unknown function [Streptomyces sp. KY70]
MTCIAAIADMRSRRPAESPSVNPLPDMGAMFHPFRLSREQKGLLTAKGGDMAHHPCL